MGYFVDDGFLWRDQFLKGAEPPLIDSAPNLNHPLAKGLEGCYIFPGRRNLVALKNPNNDGSAALGAWSSTLGRNPVAQGRSYKFTAADNDYLSLHDCWDRGTDSWMVTAVFKTHDNNANQCLVSKSEASGSVGRWTLQIRSSDQPDNRVQLLYQGTPSLSTAPIGTTTVKENQIHSVSFRCDYAGGEIHALLNGEVEITQDISDRKGSLNSNNVLLCGQYNDVNGDNDPPSGGINNFDGNIYALFFHKGLLPLAQALEFSARPFQILKPKWALG